MNVHFIDTSVFVNILDIPHMNQERTEILKELKMLVEHKDENILLLPFATIIETGNHIVHNGNGQQRRVSAERFKEIVKRTIKNESPWHYYGGQMTEEDLDIMCEHFPDYAMLGEGFGDLSIIRTYEKYKKETPAIHRIRIWTLDQHMKAQYDEVLELPVTRN